MPNSAPFHLWIRFNVQVWYVITQDFVNRGRLRALYKPAGTLHMPAYVVLQSSFHCASGSSTPSELHRRAMRSSCSAPHLTPPNALVSKSSRGALTCLW